jgi:general stress protein YciG
MTDNKPKKPRGFAAMSPEKRAEISSLGGKAAHAKGTAHEFTSEQARAAGRKGGLVVSRNRNHMSVIGTLGGQSKAEYPDPPTAYDEPYEYPDPPTAYDEPCDNDTEEV